MNGNITTPPGWDFVVQLNLHGNNGNIGHESNGHLVEFIVRPKSCLVVLGELAAYERLHWTPFELPYTFCVYTFP